MIALEWNQNMFLRSIRIFIFIIFTTATCLFAQNADNTTSLFPRNNDREEQPKAIQEQLRKLQIEKEKKDHETMLVRGDEALKISEELELKAATNAKLDAKDKANLESLEKLLKKIRNELGGDDDAESAPESDETDTQPTEAKPNNNPKDVVDGIKSLRKTTIKLVDELKKTTRFTISAAAIQTTNTVLRITRFLRFWN